VTLGLMERIEVGPAIELEWDRRLELPHGTGPLLILSLLLRHREDRCADSPASLDLTSGVPPALFHQGVPAR
jgi:hypothetical protein